MGARRKARETALQMLYQIDVSGAGVEEAIGAYARSFELDPEVAEYAHQIVRGVHKKLEAIDEAIREASQNWRMERMARVDRNVLRLAAFELLYVADVPKRVALNEAVELGKRFGAEGSAAFINGILDAIAAPLDKE